jgi:hypothetical protein
MQSRSFDVAVVGHIPLRLSSATISGSETKARTSRPGWVNAPMIAKPGPVSAPITIVGMAAKLPYGVLYA